MTAIAVVDTKVERLHRARRLLRRTIAPVALVIGGLAEEANTHSWFPSRIYAVYNNIGADFICVDSCSSGARLWI
jgi:hypothetical protein